MSCLFLKRKYDSWTLIPPFDNVCGLSRPFDSDLKKKLKKKTSIVDSELSADALWNKIYVNSPKNETLFLKKKSLVSLNLMYVGSVT